MILFAQGRTWDSIPVPNVNVDDLENDAFRLFRKKASDSGRLDKDSLDVINETLLHNLHLFENDYLTRAAILAFHPDPEKWITGAYIKIAYFENEADILYQDEIHGPLLLQVEKGIDLIYTKYMKALISYDDIYRKETFFFPRAAFRELLLNAVIHKDYLSTTPIQIRIYKDKIRLWNDGALPKEVPLENLYKEHISKPHNPNLANVFFKCGMIESWGRGFEKIESYCKEEKAKIPEIDLSLGGVTARCFASESYLKLMKEHSVNDEKNLVVQSGGPMVVQSRGSIEKNNLNETQQKIIGIMKVNPQISTRDLSEKLGINRSAVLKHIDSLKEKGFISRDNGTRGKWSVK
ncbi:ATP-binding protein [Treponema sp.]|uniref:ATP-binding protein n=1 Tax=Treponema sp. TaxID=166 RepID=UPI003FD80519